jgi:hypothetical protein
MCSRNFLGAGPFAAPYLCRVFFESGEGAMDFQVNEQTYFLTLAEDEKRWEFFVSSPSGSQRIPVYVDSPESVKFIVLEDEEKLQGLPN